MNIYEAHTQTLMLCASGLLIWVGCAELASHIRPKLKQLFSKGKEQ